jgi:hypothetical protein
MTRRIRSELVEQTNDQRVKYATAIRVGTASTTATPLHPQRLTPVYQASRLR